MSFIFKVKLLLTIKTKNNSYMVYILKKKLVLVFFNLLLNFKTKEFQIILLGSSTTLFRHVEDEKIPIGLANAIKPLCL